MSPDVDAKLINSPGMNSRRARSRQEFISIYISLSFNVSSFTRRFTAPVTRRFKYPLVSRPPRTNVLVGS